MSESEKQKKTLSNGNDDGDLADLIGNGAEQAPLKNGTRANTRQQDPNVLASLCRLVCAHISYLCFAYPEFCGALACCVAFIVVITIVANAVNPNSVYGVVNHDWTSVSSVYELDIGKIDHWCLGGGNDGCRCEDPLVPTSRVELRSWTEAFKDNVKQIENYMEDPLKMADLDLAIIGESAVEEMDGRWMGRRPDDELRNIGTIFHNRFRKDKGAKVEGVALGIAGDSANNVLWRLLNGEMHEGFEPKIWWVHVGMNDLTRMQCSEEVVVLGVLRVVEEILNRRPKARVVINSLLPMADLRGGPAVNDQDYRDAFATYRGKRGPTSATHYVRTKSGNYVKIVPKTSPPAAGGDGDEGNRRHLEEALTSYNGGKYNDSNEIEQLQRKVNAELDTFQRRLNLGSDTETEKEGTRYASVKYNPTIDREQHEQKKYQFFRRRRMPLWTSIYAINQQLFKFCEKHDRVDFFDATNIFAERKAESGGRQKFFTLLSDNIGARGHPTELGYLKWEEEIVEKSLQILQEMRTESPELFMSTAEGHIDESETVGNGRGSGGIGNAVGSGGHRDDDATTAGNARPNMEPNAGDTGDNEGQNGDQNQSEESRKGDGGPYSQAGNEYSSEAGSGGSQQSPYGGIVYQNTQEQAGLQGGVLGTTNQQQGQVTGYGGYYQGQQAQQGYQAQQQPGMQGGYGGYPAQQQPRMQGGYTSQQQPGIQGGYSGQQQSGMQDAYSAQQEPGMQGGYPGQQQLGMQSGYPGQQQPGMQGGYPGQQEPGIQGGYLNQQPGMQGGYPSQQQPGMQGGYPNQQQPGMQGNSPYQQQPGPVGDDYRDHQGTEMQAGGTMQRDYSQPQQGMPGNSYQQQPVQQGSPPQGGYQAQQPLPQGTQGVYNPSQGAPQPSPQNGYQQENGPQNDEMKTPREEGTNRNGDNDSGSGPAGGDTVGDARDDDQA